MVGQFKVVGDYRFDVEGVIDGGVVRVGGVVSASRVDDGGVRGGFYPFLSRSQIGERGRGPVRGAGVGLGGRVVGLDGGGTDEDVVGQSGRFDHLGEPGVAGLSLVVVGERAPGEVGVVGAAELGAHLGAVGRAAGAGQGGVADRRGEGGVVGGGDVRDLGGD